MKKKIYKFKRIGLMGLMGLIGLTQTGCSDFLEIEPLNEIILEKFWTEKADVEGIIAGCYSGMQDEGVVKRMMIWGEFRSENVSVGQNIDRDGDLEKILKENINAKNGYTKWDGFYSIINRCNTVLKYAPAVAAEDPAYTQSELSAHIAEVTALRSLCYFYLIRAFRDVPYTTEAYTDDDMKMDIPATPFYAVLDSLINSLESVKSMAVRRYPVTEPLYQTGRITQDAIYAMLCEMYLWKKDYQNCIKYADLVIASKKEIAEINRNSSNTGRIIGGVANTNTTEERFNGYPLISGSSTTNYFGDEYYVVPPQGTRMAGVEWDESDEWGPQDEALVTPLDPVGPLREKYLSILHYVAMVDSRSLIPDRLGGADYDGDTVHLYAEPLLSRCISRNYEGGLENADNLPLLKIPSAEPLIADANDWRARFETVKSTFSSRVGQISNAALRRSILAYDESLPAEEREQYRKETEILTILTGLEIDSAKSGIKPELSEYLGNRTAVKSLFLKYKGIAGDPDEHKWHEPSKAKRLKAFFADIEWDEITANLERTPYYARQLWKQTLCRRPTQADSAELFTFAADPNWKEKLDPETVESVRSIIADYEEAKRRCEAYRHIQPSTNYRKDIQRILFAQDKENEISVDDLYQEFRWIQPGSVRRALAALRESDWQFTPKEERLEMMYAFLRSKVPFDYEYFCDFRCGGYRILGDILMDLDEQFRIVELQKHKGVKRDDSKQLRKMLRDTVGRPDWQEQLIRNCIEILNPKLWFHGEEMPTGIPQETAVQCAELLGKRRFILEVLPAAAMRLTIDRTKPIKKKAWWKLW